YVNNNGYLRIFDINKGKIIKEFFDQYNKYNGKFLLFHPDGKKIIISLYNSLIILDIDSKESKIFFNLGEYPNKSITALNFSSNGQFLVTGFSDGDIFIWDINTGKRIKQFFAGIRHSGKISSVCFSPNCRYIASSSTNGSIMLWDIEKIAGSQWFEEYFNIPIIVTPVWFSKKLLENLEKKKQGDIVHNLPLALCPECGLFFKVEKRMLGKEIRCQNKNPANDQKCERLLKINNFIAGKKEG
ncbi:MAG: hypothetical protein HQK78_13670, partial [Desulfobacterales bacterium]|nr:hypothetical protein [Desulfobacterales bacterium]